MVGGIDFGEEVFGEKGNEGGGEENEKLCDEGKLVVSDTLGVEEERDALSDFNDSDYNCNDSDVDNDDLFFEENVENEAPVVDMIPYEQLVEEKCVDVSSEDELDSLKGSDDDGERESSVVLYNPSTKYNPVFVVGLRFACKAHFREALDGYAVNEKRNVKITISDHRRIHARCTDESCDWGINLISLKDEGGFVIFSMRPEHSCLSTVHVKRVTAKWLAGR